MIKPVPAFVRPAAAVASLVAALLATPLCAAAASSTAPDAPVATKPAGAKPTTKLGQCSAEAKKKGLKGAERKKFVSDCAKA
ncbi:MAG TPA: PsiF family protein [Burkholderiaceae bacterium]|nr:PsiF family protein [Burkholderiaceae bacterium]